jgi:C-terminal processing protease CtpA/Prc
MSSTVTPLRLATIALAASLVLLSGCSGGDGGGGGGGGGSSSGCAEPLRKRFVLDVAREWYLFPELLPASVDAAAFPTAEDLLDHLTATAREQRRDRFFSYLTTSSAENALLGNGQFIGFGLRTRTDPVNRPFVTEVFESSPAAEAGLQRGDEIVAVDAGSGFVPVSELLADGSTISDALGLAEAGVRRGLRLLRSGATFDVTLTKRTVAIDPISDLYGSVVLPFAGTTGVGYVNLRTYISTADSQLRDVFAQFRALDIDYYIVDLRYNGGGLVSTAEVLGDLLGGARSTSDVQLRTVHSSSKSSENSTRPFRPTAQSVRPVRIAFLTTEATASASEINVNTMAPWVEVAIVGEDTFGKPVGQLAFDLQGCEDRLRLVAFKTENALGQSDYYDGLAGSLQFACAASDTLDQPLGSASEGLTAAALSWIGSGTCVSLIPDVARRTDSAGTAVSKRYPSPHHASPAQHWLPGVS